MTLLNIIINILLVVGGLSAFIIYFHQKRSEKRTAATLIVNQIDHIESVVTQLKKPEYSGNLGIYKLPTLIEDNYWERYRALFIKKLTSAQVKHIDDYYYNVIEIQKGAASVESSLLFTWQYKALAEQMYLAQIVNQHTFSALEETASKSITRWRKLLQNP